MAHWDAKVYHIRFYPTNFLIGADGRRYFPVHDNLDELEEQVGALEIEELLMHGG